MSDTMSTEKNRDKTNTRTAEDEKTIRIDRNESGHWLTPTVGPGGCYAPGEYSLAAWNPRLETTRLRRETVKNCRKGSHIVIRYKWATNKWTDKEGKDRSVNEPRVNSLKPLTDTRTPQPQHKAYDP